MKIRTLAAIALPLALLSTALAAEDAVKSWSYARDVNTELILSENPETPGKPHLTLRMFGSTAEGMILNVDAVCEPVGNGLKAISGDAEDESLRITGKPGEPTLQLKADELPRFDDRDKDVEVSGSYQLLPAGELLARARKRVAAAEAQLAADYKKVAAELKKEEVAELASLQEKWKVRRDSEATFEGKGAADPRTKLEYWDKLVELTSTRLEFLKAYSRKGIPKGVTATYRDFEGGWLHLEERKQGLAFSLEVVRGPTAHSGYIDGIAKREGKRATFREVVPKDEEREPAEITFTFLAENKVQVEAKNAGYHGGARAYFEGLYFKAHPLEAGVPVD
jgi:uncharacterized protein YecT (DUF1311 family)